MALALAETTGGVVINADSAQIYRDLPILSAAPGEEELGRAEHRLYGVADGAAAMSAADWAVLARSEIGEAHAAGRLPILVGGTGMYLRTLIDGIAPVPSIDPAIRAAVRAADVAANRKRLVELDPEAAARIGPADTARIARALEVMLSTGRPLKAWQAERSGGIGQSIDLRPLILLPPRDWLYARCDARFAAMVEAGAVDEVRRLLGRGLAPPLPIMRAIGVREMTLFIANSVSFADAISAGQQATRNYAKRQYTWFAHQPPKEWTRFRDPIDGPVAIEPALELLRARA